MGGDRGRAPLRAGQVGRQLHLPQGGRGRVPAACRARAPVRRGGRRDAVRRAGTGRYVRAQDRGGGPCLPSADRSRFPARGHRFRPERAVGGHRYRAARPLRTRFHPRLRLDQEKLSLRESERRCQQSVVLVSGQQYRARGDAFGFPVSCDRRGNGHGHRQPVDVAGLRRDTETAAGALRGRRAGPPGGCDRASDGLCPADQG